MNRIQSTGTLESRASAFNAAQGDTQPQESDTLFEEFSSALKQVVQQLRKVHPQLEFAPEVSVVNERPAVTKDVVESPQQDYRDIPVVSDEAQSGSSTEDDSLSDDSSSSLSEDRESNELGASESLNLDSSDESAQISEAAASVVSQKQEVSGDRHESAKPESDVVSKGSSEDSTFSEPNEDVGLILEAGEGSLDPLAVEGKLSEVKEIDPSLNDASLLTPVELSPVESHEGVVGEVPSENGTLLVERADATLSTLHGTPAAESTDSLNVKNGEQLVDTASAPELESVAAPAPVVPFTPPLAQDSRAPIRKEASVLLNEISAALASVMGNQSSPSSPRVAAEVGQMAKAVDAIGGAARNSSNAPASQFGGLGLNEKAQGGEGLLRSQRTVARAALARSLEKVEEVLKEAVRAKDGRSISVRLDPPELGSVKIDLTMRDGGLHARLVSDSAQVSAVLRERAGDLHLILRKSGIEVDQITVIIRTVGDEEQVSFDAQYSQSQNGSWQFGEGEGEGRRQSSQSRSDADASGGKVMERTQDVLDHWVA